MKGADQCPRCASRKWTDREVPKELDFYAKVLRVCANCPTAWEPFEVADLLDADDKTSCFKAPCNNCAFRKGSIESRDPEEFKAMREKLGWNKGWFYCHKGVPLAPETENGFDYPEDRRKLRFCKGFLNTLPDPLPLDGK